MIKKVENSFEKTGEWDTVILPESSSYSVRTYLKSIARYKDLIFLLVKRDFVSQYKQTILGPIWYLIAPVLTTFTFFILLSKIGNVSYNQIPPLLFIFSGIILWSYFSENFIKISETFISNVSLFGKVYFPRAVVPISVLISGLIKFSIQFFLLLFMLVYFSVRGFSIGFSFKFLLFPFFVLFASVYAASLGMLVSSLTIKYRDLRYLVQFFTQLLMFFSPIVYTISTFSEKTQFLFHLNPFTDLIEGFRYVVLGSSNFRLDVFIIQTVFLAVLFCFSIRIFSRAERKFLDSV